MTETTLFAWFVIGSLCDFFLMVCIWAILWRLR